MWLDSQFGLPDFWGHRSGNGRHQKRMATWKNREQYRDYFTLLVDIFLNLFEWKGLPETCNSRVLETTLFFYGKAVFQKDPKFSYIHTPVVFDEGLNIYYEPVTVRAYSYNYERRLKYGGVLADPECVIIRNTRQMYASWVTAQIWAEKIVDAGRSIDVLAKRMKNPYFIFADKDLQKTVEFALKDIDNNEMAVFFNRATRGGEAPFELANTSYVHGSLTDIWEHKHNLESEIQSRFGIDNAHTDKRERLITDEVESEKGNINANLNILLDSRKEACEEINKLFGLNVSCDMKHKEEEYEEVESLEQNSGD